MNEKIVIIKSHFWKLSGYSVWRKELWVGGEKKCGVILGVKGRIVNARGERRRKI